MPKIPKIPKNEIVGKRILLEPSLAKSKNKITPSKGKKPPKIKTMTKTEQKKIEILNNATPEEKQYLTFLLKGNNNRLDINNFDVMFKLYQDIFILPKKRQEAYKLKKIRNEILPHYVEEEAKFKKQNRGNLKPYLVSITVIERNEKKNEGGGLVFYKDY
jgi:hypothetical protein